MELYKPKNIENAIRTLVIFAVGTGMTRNSMMTNNKSFLLIYWYLDIPIMIRIDIISPNPESIIDKFLSFSMHKIKTFKNEAPPKEDKIFLELKGSSPIEPV